MNGFKLKNNRVIVLGDAFVDLVTKISRMPPTGGSVWGTSIKMHPGGASANVASNLSKLAIPSSFLGCIGDDIYGQYILDSFKVDNVDTSLVIEKENAYTGAVFVAVNSGGERTFFPCALNAAHTLLDINDVEQVNMSDFSVLFACGVSLVEQPSCNALIHSLSSAKTYGIVTFFDPNLRLEGDVFTEEYRLSQWRAIREANVILIGDDECQILCETSDIEKSVYDILETGPDLVVVKSGSKGATAYSRDCVMHSAALTVPVEDTTGAGDAFDAGFMAALVRGLTVKEALSYGNVVAGLKVTKQGARNIPTHEKTLALMHKIYREFGN